MRAQFYERLALLLYYVEKWNGSVAGDWPSSSSEKFAAWSEILCTLDGCPTEKTISNWIAKRHEPGSNWYPRITQATKIYCAKHMKVPDDRRSIEELINSKVGSDVSSFMNRDIDILTLALRLELTSLDIGVIFKEFMSS